MTILNLKLNKFWCLFNKIINFNKIYKQLIVNRKKITISFIEGE